MKKLLILLSLVVSVFLISTIASANQRTVTQNPQKLANASETVAETVIESNDVAIAAYRNNRWQTSVVNPQFSDGYTLVPLRVITSQSSAKVHWNGALRTVTIKYGKDEVLELVVGQKESLHNKKTDLLPATPLFVGGTTYVPFRYIAEKLDFHVTWDGSTRTIFLLDKNSAETASLHQRYRSQLKQNGVLQSLLTTEDALVVATSKDASPFVFVLDKPDRIVVDLAQTMIHPTDRLPFVNNHPNIARVRFAQNTTNPAVVRIVVELKKSMKYQLIEDAKSSVFVLRIGDPVKPPAPAPEPKVPTPTPVIDTAKVAPVSKQVSTNVKVEPRVTKVTFADEKVTVQLNAPVKWSAYMLDKPDRLVLDLPGMILDEKVTKSLSSKMDAITQVRTAQNSISPPLVKLVVDFKKVIPYKITEQDESKQVTIDFSAKANLPEPVKPTPVTNPATPPPITPINQNIMKQRKTVVIDAGHGGLDSGAVSMYRENGNEKDFNLNVALRVQQLLTSNDKIQVVMTRTTDTFLTLNERVDIANRLKADAFVSIHANAFKNLTSIRGTETFYSRSDSYDLAQIMHQHILDVTGFPDRRVKKVDYRVIYATTMPAVLLEAGFISNPIEEKFIFDTAFQNRVAEAIVKALNEYFAE